MDHYYKYFWRVHITKLCTFILLPLALSIHTQSHWPLNLSVMSVIWHQEHYRHCMSEIAWSGLKASSSSLLYVGHLEEIKHLQWGACPLLAIMKAINQMRVVIINQAFVIGICVTLTVGKVSASGALTAVYPFYTLYAFPARGFSIWKA